MKCRAVTANVVDGVCCFVCVTSLADSDRALLSSVTFLSGRTVCVGERPARQLGRVETTESIDVSGSGRHELRPYKPHLYAPATHAYIDASRDLSVHQSAIARRVRRTQRVL